MLLSIIEKEEGRLVSNGGESEAFFKTGTLNIIIYKASRSIYL